MDEDEDDLPTGKTKDVQSTEFSKSVGQHSQNDTEGFHALCQARKMSACLMPYLPNIITDHSQGLVFKLEEVRYPPQSKCLSALVDIRTGFDPLTNKVEMKYRISLDGQSVPMKYISSDSARKVYERMINIIESSNYPMYNPVIKDGFWSGFVIQVNHIGEVLLSVEGHVQDNEDVNDTMDPVCLYLENNFKSDNNCNVTSLVMSVKQKDNYFSTMVLGQGFIKEMVGDFKINVYGKYHSLVNPNAVKEISDAIKDVTQLDKSWNILQLGVGHDGVTFYLSQMCKKIHMVSNDNESGLHSLHNAVLNTVQNFIFRSGSILEQLKDILNIELKCSKLCVLVWEFYNESSDSDEDVKLLREHSSVQKIVLLSDVFIERNVSKLLTLCQNQSPDHEPFIIVKAIPVKIQPDDTKIIYLLVRQSLVPTPVKVRENECESLEKCDKPFCYEHIVRTYRKCEKFYRTCEKLFSIDQAIDRLSSEVTGNPVESIITDTVSEETLNKTLTETKKTSDILHDANMFSSVRLRGGKRNNEDESGACKRGKFCIEEFPKSEKNKGKHVIESNLITVDISDNTNNTEIDHCDRNDMHVETNAVYDDDDDIHIKIERDDNDNTIGNTCQDERESILNEWHTDLDIENYFHTQLSRTMCDTPDEYDEQLKLKQMWTLSHAVTMSNILKRILPITVKDRTQGLVFNIVKIRACPITKCVSDRFQVVSECDTDTGQLSMEHNLHLPRRHFSSDIIINIYEYLMKYINKSTLPLFNPVSEEGFWKKIVIRINNVKESLVIVEGHANSRKEANVIFSNLAEELEAYFSCTEASSFKPMSLVLKIDYGSGRVKQKALFGCDFLNDVMGEFKVRVYDDLFLYSNPFGSEVLSNTIVDLAGINNSWFILQIGYGDCITSLNLAKRCRTVFILDDGSSPLGLHLLSNAQQNSISNIHLLQPKDGNDRINSLLNNKLKYLKRICVVINNFSFLTDREVSSFHEFPKVKKIVCLSDCHSYLELKTVFTLCREMTSRKDLFVITNATSVDLSPYEGNVKFVYLLERESLLESSLEPNKSFSRKKVSEFEDIKDFKEIRHIHPETLQRKDEKMLTISKLYNNFISAQKITNSNEKAAEEVVPEIVIENVISLRDQSQNIHDKDSQHSESSFIRNVNNNLINDLDNDIQIVSGSSKITCDTDILILEDPAQESSLLKNKQLNVKNNSVQSFNDSGSVNQYFDTVNKSSVVINNNRAQNVQTISITQSQYESGCSNIVDNVSVQSVLHLPDSSEDLQNLCNVNLDDSVEELVVCNKETEVINLEDDDSSNQMLNLDHQINMNNTENKTKGQICNNQGIDMKRVVEAGSGNTGSIHAKEKAIDNILNKTIEYLYNYYSKEPAKGLAVIQNLKKQNPNLSLNSDLQKFVKQIDVGGVNFTSLSTIGKSFIEIGLLLSEKNAEGCCTEARTTVQERQNAQCEINMCSKPVNNDRFQLQSNNIPRKRQLINQDQNKLKKRKKLSHNEPVVNCLPQKAHTVDYEKLALREASLLSSALTQASSSFPVFSDTGLVFILDNIKRSDMANSSSEKFQVFSGVQMGNNKAKLAYSAHKNGSLVDLSHVHSNAIKLIYGKMLSFIKKSGYEIYNPDERFGFWKSMAVLVNECGEAMVMIEGHIGRKKNTEDVTIISKLTAFLRKYCQRKIVNSSTVLASIIMKTCYIDKTHVRTVLGEDFLTYKQDRLTIKVFSDSILTNPFEIEVLSNMVLEVAEINNTWGVLQICCKYDLPTLKLAQACKKVIILNRNDVAGENLVKNARGNNIDNLYYIPGSKGQLSWKILEDKLDNCEKVCVLIYRLHKLADYSCRRLLCDKRIKKIMYISDCFISDEAKKVTYLCNKDISVTKDPFVLVKGVPVVTPYCNDKVEMLYLLVRKSNTVLPSSSHNATENCTKTVTENCTKTVTGNCPKTVTGNCAKTVKSKKRTKSKATTHISNSVLATSCVQTNPSPRIHNLNGAQKEMSALKSDSVTDKTSKVIGLMTETVTPILSQPTVLKDGHLDTNSKITEVSACDKPNQDTVSISGTIQPNGTHARNYESEDNVGGDKILYKRIDVAVYGGSCKTLEQLKQYITWKEQWVFSQARCFSDTLKPVLPKIVTFHTKDLVYVQDKLLPTDVKRYVSNSKTFYGDKFEIFSGCDSRTGNLTMMYKVFSDCSGIPVTKFRLPIFKHFYENTMAFINKSGYGLYHPKDSSGSWRHVILTINEARECMLVVIGHLLCSPEEITRLSSLLKECFQQVQIFGFNLVSLVLQIHHGDDIKILNLLGDGYLTYRLGTLNVKVHAFSPQYPNCRTVKLLSEVVIVLARVDKSWSVVQLGCGYLLASLYLAQISKNILVFDKLHDQGESMVALAQENGINNLKYLSDNVLHSQFKKTLQNNPYMMSNICVFINESHQDSFDPLILRDTLKVKKIVIILKYNNDTMMRKLCTLCCSRSTKSWTEPFVIIRATPVDMSPYENNIKIVYLLARESEMLQHLKKNGECCRMSL